MAFIWRREFLSISDELLQLLETVKEKSIPVYSLLVSGSSSTWGKSKGSVLCETLRDRIRFLLRSLQTCGIKCRLLKQYLRGKTIKKCTANVATRPRCVLVSSVCSLELWGQHSRRKICCCMWFDVIFATSSAFKRKGENAAFFLNSKL